MIDAPASLLLSPGEIRDLTKYERPAEQLAELHRQGFFRARRDRLGGVVLERAHYDAVCRRALAANDAAAAEDYHPRVRPVVRPARR